MAWNYRGMQDMNRGTVLRLIVMTVIMLSWASAVEAANPVLQSEREALLALYSSTNGASWTNNSGVPGSYISVQSGFNSISRALRTPAARSKPWFCRQSAGVKIPEQINKREYNLKRYFC